MYKKKTFKACDEKLINSEKLVTEIDFDRKQRIFHTKNPDCEALLRYDKKGNCIISIKSYKLSFDDGIVTVIQKITAEYDLYGNRIYEKEIIIRNRIDEPDYFFIHDETEYFYVNEYEFYKNGKPKKCITHKFTKAKGEKK